LRFCPLQCGPAAWLDRPMYPTFGLIPLRRCPAGVDHGLTFVARRRRRTALAVFRPACVWQRVSHCVIEPVLVARLPPRVMRRLYLYKAAFRYPRDRIFAARSGPSSGGPDSAHGVHAPFAVLILPAGLLDVSTHSDPRAVGRTSTSIIWSRDRPRDDFITHIPMLEEAPADHERSLRLLGFVPAGNRPRRRS